MQLLVTVSVMVTLTKFLPRIALSNAWIMSFENTPDRQGPPAKFRDKAELTEPS